MKTGVVLFFIGIVFVVGVIVGSILEAGMKGARWSKEAVLHGCAEFVVTDSTNGQVEFRWKDTAPTAQKGGT